MSNPLMLVNDIVKHYSVLSVTDVDADSQYAGTNIADWKYNTLWKALSSGTKYFTIRTRNDCTNGDFEAWDSAGVLPDNWTLSGGGSSVQEGVIVKLGTYSVKLTADADGNQLNQTLDLPTFRGKTIVFSKWVYAADANTARIGIYDNVTGWTYSSYHTGGSGWEYLTVTAAISASATSANVSGFNEGNLTVVYLDEADYAETKYKTANGYSIFNHNFLTADATVSLEYSSDNFATVITEASAGFIFLSNKGHLKTFTQVVANYWRLKMVTASVVPYLGVVWIGPQMEFPNPQKTPLVLRNEQPILETTRARKGQPLAIVRSYILLTIKVKILMITTTWFDANFLPFWDDHASNGSSFPFAWDATEEPDLISWVKIKSKYKMKEIIKSGDYVDVLTFEMEAVKE